MSKEDNCLCEVEVKKPSIYDKIIKTPKKEKCPANHPPFDLNNMDIEKVLVEYKVRRPVENPSEKETGSVRMGKSVSAMGDCEAFKLSGFQPDWTKEKIEILMNSDDGRALLDKVDKEFKRLTGKTMITESDIIKCYPNYLKKSKNIQMSIKID